MKKVFLALAAALVVGIVPAAASLSSSSSPVKKPGVFKTRAISFLAADGSRAAVVTDGPVAKKSFGTWCYRVVVWNVATRKWTRINPDVCPGSSAVNVILGLALAGKRVAWLEGVGGNSLELGVTARDLGAKKNVDISGFTSNSNGAEGYPDGGYVGNLVGKGNALAFSYWSVCTAIPEGAVDDIASCNQPAPGARDILIYSDQWLVGVVGKKSTTIAQAPDSEGDWTSNLETIFTHDSIPTAVWVDAGRIVAQPNSGGPITIYSAKGTVLKTIAVPNGASSGTVLQGSQLATLSNGHLYVYDVSSGALKKTIPLQATALRDLQKGIAVYLNGRSIHVLRLSDGKQFKLTLPGKGFVDAQIEAPGLYYVYNLAKGTSKGHIVFVPFATVLKKLR
jgi:hypothetical protein